jgi:hypothetical protein
LRGRDEEDRCSGPAQANRKQDLISTDKAWWCLPTIPVSDKFISGRIMVQGEPWAKNVRPYLENNLKQKELEM